MEELQFVDWQWEDYQSLRANPEKKKQQINLLYATGLIETVDGIEYTFVPTKKMLELEKNIQNLYEKIHVTDTEIQLCNEVFYTSKIEGAHTTLVHTQKIHEGVETDGSFSETMVANGFQATKFLNLYPDTFTEEILLKVWKILTDGACNNIDIIGVKYRDGNVQVGNHMGLNPELLEQAMQNWIIYYNSKNLQQYPFIKAALLHFSFEFIHPFCDGNGRCGRLLMNNFLIQHGYEKVKAVSFSRSIEKNRALYDAEFAVSDNVYTDCTSFIEYMLTQMQDAFLDILDGIDFTKEI